MINDTIINFYLLYYLSSYIDCQLKSLGIDPSVAHACLSTPLDALNKDEKFRLNIIESVVNRFYAFHTSTYLQFCSDYVVGKHISFHKQKRNEKKNESLFLTPILDSVAKKEHLIFPVFSK